MHLRQEIFSILTLFCRVGTKESGTRFLTYVDAVAGFRHLLQQADLDRTMSLCTGMKGKLKSRFVVLSDDRVLPPPPPRGQRAKHKPDSEPDGSFKRTRPGRTTPAQGVASVPPPNAQRVTTPIPGVTSIPPAVAQHSNTLLQSLSRGGPGMLRLTSPNTQPLVMGAASFQSALANSHPGYFTAPSGHLPGSQALFMRQPIVPPTIHEQMVEANQLGSDQSSQGTKDWASANSDETIIQ